MLKWFHPITTLSKLLLSQLSLRWLKEHKCCDRALIVTHSNSVTRWSTWPLLWFQHIMWHTVTYFWFQHIMRHTESANVKRPSQFFVGRDFYACRAHTYNGGCPKCFTRYYLLYPHWGNHSLAASQCPFGQIKCHSRLCHTIVLYFLATLTETVQRCWQNVTAIIVIFTFPVLLRRIPRLLVGATLTRVRPLCFDWHEFNTVGREDTQKPPVPNDHNFRHSKPTQPISTCQASPKKIAFTFRYICTFFPF